MSAFPSSVSARACITQGDCGDTLYWILRRTLLISTGLRFAGEKEHLFKKSLYGSLAVQGFVMAWTAAHLDQPEATLPSGEAALNGNPAEIAGTYITRAFIVGTGLYAAGERKHLIRNALAGTAAIEIMVLLWAKMENSKS